MAAFFNISVWVTLAMVAPGLVTMAVLFLTFSLIDPATLGRVGVALGGAGEGVGLGAAISVMVLTQALGILLEGALVRGRRLGPDKVPITIPPGIDPCELTSFTLKPYEEYDGLYLLLAELRSSEDSHGHLQRALAQFFLTNNTMVSFGAGIVATLILSWNYEGRPGARGWILVAALASALAVSYRVAQIRFRVMAKALWAARRRRLSLRVQAKDAQHRAARRAG